MFVCQQSRFSGWVGRFRVFGGRGGGKGRRVGIEGIRFGPRNWKIGSDQSTLTLSRCRYRQNHPLGFEHGTPASG